MENGAAFRIFQRGLVRLAAAAVGVGALAFVAPLVRMPVPSQLSVPSAVATPATIERPRRLGRIGSAGRVGSAERIRRLRAGRN